ncbi:MAG: hypothetical protein FWE42_01695 [Defluviitaleaceae bacterium]|nr:hypothetical protein [Defluviitaleaceae bacterium]
MELFITILFVLVGLIIQYFIIKAAVRNGTTEAQAQLDHHLYMQMKRAVADGTKAALTEGENPFLISLHNTIQDAVTAAAEKDSDQ